MRLKNILILVLLGLGFKTYAFDQFADIPLQNIRMPSDDLLLPNGDRIGAEKLWQMIQDTGFDTSTLEPFETEIYNSKNSDNDDADQLIINSNDQLDFRGVLTSSSGTFRFNAYSKKYNTIATIMLDKTLHTTLLRKNLLRKLGYVIPGIKYLKKISIKFESLEDLKLFKERSIPEATLGASSRWIIEKESDEKNYLLSLRDIAVMIPSVSDHYNLALGVPPKRQTARQLRSLIIPYALLNVRESVNKLPWNVGRIDNKKIELPHFALADFDATLEDALWMLRKVVTLNRTDYEDIVKNAYFPKEVGLILIEKLISRRNSLVKLFKMDEAEIAINSELSSGDILVKGKIVKENFSDFASRFAYGNAESPFTDTHLHILSKLQGGMIDALISRANSELQAFDIREPYVKFHQNQFKKGLEHFVKTGEFLDFGVGAWVSPILNGELILSRDVVVGNYMGTDNLVQLADTFGYAVSLGTHVGIENLPFNYTASNRTTLNYVKTYAHLKPVKTIKDTFKEPYKNMIVPFVKKRLQKQIGRLSDLVGQGNVGGESDNSNQEEISEIIKELNEVLGVGESLIVTDRIAPQTTTTGGALLGSISMRLSFGAEHVNLKRLHIHRKNAEVIQVYIDNGYANNLMLTFGINNYLPVVSMRGKVSRGKYNVEAHNISLNTDLETNPNLEKKAFALKHLLMEGSSELLKEIENPYRVNGDFLDKSLRIKVFHWRNQSLNAQNELKVLTPDNYESSYITSSRVTQMGINPNAFVTDIVNYALGEFFPKYDLEINVNNWANPGQSAYGISQSVGSRFEAAYHDDNKKLSRYFLNLIDRREGWKITKKRFRELLQEFNEKYQTVLFPSRTLEDASDLKVYDLTVNINLYERGLHKLKNISIKEIEKIEKRYKKERGDRFVCRSRSGGINNMRRNTYECGNLNLLKNLMKRCQTKIVFNGNKKEIDDSVACIQEIAEKMRHDLDFHDFVSLIGEDNIYLYGTLSGFRGDSEILYEPLNSNTRGKIGARYPNGPVDALRNILGLQAGEFNGLWIRENL